jgi:hypothetical protein
LAEVKSAIDKLSDEDQFHLRNYLQDKMLDNEEWRAEMSRRLDEMDEGKKITSAQFEALHRDLESKGR